MARTGRFGRLPRRAPNLTGEIVAMAEAFERQRETNLLAAWNSGGTFEGKKATDGMVLSFWKKRMKEVSKDDPLHEYYKNLHTQYTFSIAESKMTLAYAQKKIGEGAVASFYRRWAGKVPRRSEIYRELMRNAARFANAASAGSRGSGASNKAAIYARKDKALYDQFEAAGKFLEDQLTAWMRAERYLTGAPDMVGEAGDRGETLDDMTMDLSINPEQGDGALLENDAQAFLLLLEAADQDPEWSAYINKQMKRLDPSYSGKIDFNQRYYISTQRRRVQGLNKRIKLAKRYGVSETDIARLKASRLRIRRQVVQTRLLDEHLDYADSRAQLDDAFNDPGSSFTDLVVAHSDYIGDLDRIVKDVRETKNDQLVGFRASLNGELAALTGRELIAEGRTAAEGGGMIAGDALTASEENIAFSQASQDLYEIIEQVESGNYGIIELAEGEGNILGSRNWSVVDNNDPRAGLGDDYAALPVKMDPYSRTTYAEPETAKEKFRGRGKKEVINGGGYTYTEYVKTQPLVTRMLQIDPVADTAAVDPRTGMAVGSGGGYVQPTTDQTLGEVAVDNKGNVLGYKIYDTTGGSQWFDVTENPLKTDLLVGGEIQLNSQGEWVAVIDPSNENAVSTTDSDPKSAGYLTKTAYDPRQVVDGTKVDGWLIEDEGTWITSEGSPTSMPSLAMAKMAVDENYRKSVLDNMTDEDILKTISQEPDFQAGDPQKQQDILSEATGLLNTFRSSATQSELEQNLTLQKTGDPSANSWQQAQEASETAATPETVLPDGPEILPEDFGSDSWDDIINEQGMMGITGQTALSNRQMSALGAGALAYDEDGNLVATDKTKAPEDRPELDVTQSDAYTSMIDDARAKVTDQAAPAEAAPSPSPRIKPPEVETPDATVIGPQAGPSPSPSPRIQPDRPEKTPEPKAPEPYKVDPNVSTKQDIKNRPPGTKGSPYAGPVAPEHVEKPKLDITKPYGWS